MRHQGEHFDYGLGRGNFWGLGGLIFHQKSGECHDIQRKQIKIIFLKIKCTNNRYDFAATIPAKPGNPASIYVQIVPNKIYLFCTQTLFYIHCKLLFGCVDKWR